MDNILNHEEESDKWGSFHHSCYPLSPCGEETLPDSPPSPNSASTMPGKWASPPPCRAPDLRSLNAKWSLSGEFHQVELMPHLHPSCRGVWGGECLCASWEGGAPIGNCPQLQIEKTNVSLPKGKGRGRGGRGNVRGQDKQTHIAVKMKVKSLSHVWLLVTLWTGPPGSSIHGISQGGILEKVAISFSRGSSQPRDWTQVSCIVGRHFIIQATREVYTLLYIYTYTHYIYMYKTDNQQGSTV